MTTIHTRDRYTEQIWEGVSLAAAEEEGDEATLDFDASGLRLLSMLVALDTGNWDVFIEHYFDAGFNNIVGAPVEISAGNGDTDVVFKTTEIAGRYVRLRVINKAASSGTLNGTVRAI